MTPIIKGSLYKEYGDDIKIVFQKAPIIILRDEIYLLVGRNGIGKSTLLKVLARIENNHRDTLEWSITKNEQSYMPSHLAYYPYMSVSDLLDFHLLVNPTFFHKDAKMLLDAFKIDLYQTVRRLSDGQKKILSYVIALSYDVSLYLIDEPFPNVDLVFDETFRKMILNRADEHKSFVIATHQINQFETVAGKVLFIKSPSEIEVIDVETIRSEYHMSVEEYVKDEMKRLAI
ncbi:MAG: ATP-binding cassette domain-containing protein [Acholeplasmataceae bacterium]|nr:ATP-binding cassette domain-containing protein [Acholeplasmataceae bacterium]